MKASSKAWLLVLVELSLFVVDHQAPVLYVWHMPPAEVQIIGRVDAPTASVEKDLSPWKRNAVSEPKSRPTTRPIRSLPPQSSQHEQTKNLLPQPQKEKNPIPPQQEKDHVPPQQENKRDISLEDILIEEDHRRLRGDGKVKGIRKKKIHHKNLKGEDICFHIIDFSMILIKNFLNLDQDTGWPNGTYGLPRANSGCPSSTGFEWETGFRFQDTEDDFTDNQKSDSYHLAGKVSDDGIRQEFCMKTNPYGNRNWPEGKYCIYKKGAQCPKGLESGFVIWDDENKDNKDSAEGTLPEGRFSEDTKIFFCCSATGDWDDPIVLPTDRPFYLFAFESNKCQKVEGMEAVSEFIKFDDQDRGNTDYEGGFYPYGVNKGSKDHTIFLCYYTPIGKVWDSIVEIAPMPTLVKPKHKSTNFKTKQKGKKKKIDKLEEMEKLRSSEKMMDAFLAATSQHNEETDKSERTKTIIKTIRVPERVKDSTTTIIATTMGVVLGALILGSALLIIISRHIRKRHEARIDSMEDHDITFSNSSRRSSFATSDDEIELTEGDYEDELVEDQYLPSDSELKSGLELMFLKQQRHYWTKNKKP